MESDLQNEKRMKRKKLEEMLFIKGDIYSDDDLSLTCDEKVNINLLKMSASSKARAMKEAELEKMRKRREEMERNQSDSDESEEESDDMTDSDSEELDEIFDENDDDEAQLRAMIEKAKETTSKLQAEHGKFAGDYGRSDEDSKKPNAKNKLPLSKIGGGDTGDGSSNLRRSLRHKEQKPDEPDDEEDIFITRLRQKEKELKDKYKIDKIPFLNDPTLRQNRRTSTVVSSSESSDSEAPAKTVAQMAKDAKAKTPFNPASSSTAAKKLPAQKKNLSETEAELKKKFESLKKLLPPKTEEIESVLKKVKKPGSDWVASQKKQITKNLEQMQSTPKKANPPTQPRPVRADSASTRGRPQFASTSEAGRAKSPVGPAKKPVGATLKPSTKTPAKKIGGPMAPTTSALRHGDLDSEPVRDLSMDMKKMMSTSLRDIGSSPTGRMVLRSGKKLDSSKLPDSLNAMATKMKPRGAK